MTDRPTYPDSMRGWTIDQIRAEITRTSGSGKRLAPGARRHGIYSTMTLPGLDDMTAVRDTMQRFRDFSAPDSMIGVTFLDLGSNVGAMALEAARRGARVVGVEFREDRVHLCNMLAERYDLDARFYAGDFNDYGSGQIGEEWWDRSYLTPADVVLCSSVDEYILDCQRFYSDVRKLVDQNGELWFESNIQDRTEYNRSTEETIAMLEIAGFAQVVYRGNGNSGGMRRKRKLYTARVS